MNKCFKISLVVLLMGIISSCSVKSTNTKLKPSSSGSSSINSPSSGPTGTGGTGTTSSGTSTTTGGIGCDGINNNDATICYYKNVPTIQVMGVSPYNVGQTIWSSRNLGASFQPHLVTDETFNVRIVPRIAVKTNPAVNPSYPGKSCNHLMTKIATKLYVQIKLQTKEEDMNGSSDGEVATLSAAIGEASSVWHFSQRVTPSNLVLKVVSVLSDSRCQQGGTGYCPYSDIPLNKRATTLPTECVAFDIQYSTDNTYDLPGPAAN